MDFICKTDSKMKKVLPYIIITCLLSWLTVLIAYYAGLRINTTPYMIFGVFYMFLPAIVSIVLQKYLYKKTLTKPLFIHIRFNKWLILAIFLPIILSILSVVVSSFLPGVEINLSGDNNNILRDMKLDPQRAKEYMDNINRTPPVVIFMIFILQAVVAACTANGLAAFGEELGWRGYMLRHLSHWSFGKVCLLTGFVWGIWHFPLILMGHNYPSAPYWGVLFIVVFCMLISPIMTYLVIKTKSVITAAVFHGSINATAALHLYYLKGGNNLSNGLLGYSGFTVIVFATVCFYCYDRYMSKENIFSNPPAKYLD